MSSELFNEFPEVSAKQWKQKIQYDLKGADYNQTLVWNSPDGISVNPFYHPETTPPPLAVNPQAGWNICEKIYVSSAGIANKKALDALEKGAESLWFIFPSEEIELEELLQDIDLEKVRIFIKCNFLSSEYFKKFTGFLHGKDHRIRFLNDIIGKLARSGNWFHSLTEDFSTLKTMISEAEGETSVLNVDSGLYQNAGANIPQQLAYALAHATEYLNFLENEQLLNAEDKRGFKIQFLVAVGPNYFFEIAKLRALRLLFSSVTREFGFSEECFVLAQPSKRNKTLYDYNVNLLRTTTECMSAVLGGSDDICNMPYDALFHKDNDFGSRIARNQLLILKHESFFEKVANPAEGSYYIETLTRQLAEKALEIFKDIEQGGGFLKLLKQGTIQKKIAESAAREQEQFENGELVLIGTNKYANKEDRMKKDLELYPFLKKNPRKTLLEPILERRLSVKSEQKRLEEEK